MVQDVGHGVGQLELTRVPLSAGLYGADPFEIDDFPGDDLARDATYRLAHHLQSRGEDKEASRHYRRLAQDFPDSELAPSALFASGCCLARSGSDEEAVADWARLIDAYPQAKALVEQATYHRATSEIRLGRDENADRSLRQLLKAFPKSEFVADAHYWRGMLLREAGNLSDAEKELRAALLIFSTCDCS